MRKSDRFIARVLHFLVTVVAVVVLRWIERPIQSRWGENAYIIVILFMIPLCILPLGYVYRDNMVWGRWFLKRGWYEWGIRELELGVENRHVGATIGLGDILLFGYRCRAHPRRAIALYDYAFSCMVEYEESKPEYIWLGRGRMMEPSCADSVDAGRNRQRLRNMTVRLEAAADLSDPEVRQLLALVYQRLGDPARSRKYSD